MKKWLSLLFVVASMLFLSAGIVNAAKVEALVPKLILDGKVLEPMVPPVVIGQTTMIPVRIATESLGYKVDYDNNKKQVTVSNSTKKLIMTLDKPTAYLDDEPQQMILPPTAKSNNILIPLRFLGDSLGVQVFWDNQSKSAFLYSSNNTNTGTKPVNPPDDGLIGVVDETDNTDGGSNGDVTETPEVPVTPETPDNSLTSGNLYEVFYEADSVALRYEGTLTPSVFMLDNPRRLVVDLPNTTYASDFLPAVDFTKASEGKVLVADHPALKSIRYSMFGEGTKAPRFVLDLQQAWDYEIINDSIVGELRIILKKPQSPNNKSLYTVVLDAGHGGSDPGAISITKRPEKDFNLSVILKVYALLAKDERLNLVLTRSDDSFPSLQDRYKLANSVNADLFVSVHANSYTAATNGTETYYTRPESKDFANLMHSVFAPATGLKDNGVRQKSLAVTRETTMPAILLEVGYLSSKIDEPQLWTEALQNRVAEAIAKGIKLQLKLS